VLYNEPKVNDIHYTLTLSPQRGL